MRINTTRVALAAVVALVLAACGNGADDPGVTDTTDAGAVGIVVAVSATEYDYQLSQNTFETGQYIFEMVNDGQMPHDLVIEGPGINGERTAVITPGQSASLSVFLEPGTYQLWCSVAGHRTRGMEVTIQVN